ncbi:molybdenum ABC transporter ATP-binding protein [Pseudorhodobacter sp.]|uniref:molybdenum ABC transporter ATP-binding protein n=1 Tax=Pseudorhodobacter sp. TaxID=1934400 RepID=UPI002648C1D7|nr:molybdenum ABC transporter ATP-binding protein [Pseudorhodobacter sp.]MDN5787383.1 molybdenum ABC transporter ATP-binding protein [Pseudorhodobacter sp.]
MLTLDITLRFPGFCLQVAQKLPQTGITALFGRSGSGKSTLLRVIAGLESRATGRVAYGDDIWQDARHFTPPHKRGLGYVFQDTRLFPHLTVAGNLHYADRRARGLPGPTRDEVTAALDLGPLLQRRPQTLSGGEQSRAAIGRALLTRPRMLLMDEPLAALDEARRAEVLPYLERLRDRIGTPILYVSHNMAEVARLASHLLLIDAGRISHAGALQDLLASPDTISALGVREAGAVIHARLAAQDDDGLSQLHTSAGPLYLPRIDAAIGTSLRIRILAQDVILSRTAPTGLSALNILPATVTELHSGSGPGALVQLRTGDELILARITRRSATALDLAPGTPCFAIVKSVSVAPGNIGKDRAPTAKL